MILSLVTAAALGASANGLSWHNDVFANEFWVLDHVADWETGEGNLYKAAFEKRFKLDEAQRGALKGYVAVRAAHAKEEQTEPDVRAPVRSMFPPKLRAEDRFAISFLTAADEGAAGVAAQLDPSELKTVVAAFHALRPQLDVLLEDDDYLTAAMQKLEAGSARAKADDFIAQMKSFYGVTDDAPFRVHVLWAPPHYGQSTVWGHEVILTLTRKTAENEKDLLSDLGVVVHELGHSFLSALPEEETAALARRIVDTGGILNQRHHNIIDEATQTALGNIVFVRDRLPEAFDRGTFYDYEPKNAFPDAIDSLARALEPLVPLALGKPRGFATVFLPKALETQQRLFGNTPLHHAHVALLLTGTKAAQREFDGLFWGVSRFGFDVTSTAEFAKASHDNDGISRWVVLTAPQATPERLTALEVPQRVRVVLGANDACARAARRRAEGGYDVVVVGRDDEALRKMLIALNRATSMPEAQPLCLKP